MMTRALTLTAAAIALVSANAQTVLPSSGDPLLISGSASDLPSLQGFGFQHLALTLPTISGNAANSSMDAGALQELLWSDQLSQAAVDRLVQGDGDVAYLNMDAQLQAIGLSYNFLRTDSTAWLSIGLEHRERSLTALRIDQQLIEYLYYGNKRYAGSTVNFDPLEMRNFTYRSIGGNAAIDIPLEGTDWHIRPAVGLYFLKALEGVQFDGSNVALYTSPDGRYVDVTADYRMDVAVPDEFDPWKPGAGKGFATDIAVAGVWKDRLQVHLGMNDIGSIRMTGGVTNYTHSGTSRYDGVEVDLSAEGGDPEVTWDTLVDPFDAVETNEAFTMRLPTTMLLYAQYGIGMSKVKGMHMPRHLVWGNVRNALSDDHFNRSRLGGAVGYTYNLNDRVNAGAAFTMPGGGNFLVGLHATVRMGPVRLGLSSRDLMWLASPNTSLSADGRMTLQLAF